MRISQLQFLTAVLLLNLAPVVRVFSAPRRAPPTESSTLERQSLDFGWRFHPGDLTNASSPSCEDSQWRKMNVPHDWSIEGPFREDNKAGKAGGYAPLGVGWYRRTFELRSEDAGKKVFLNFDGVFAQADVWVNGQKVGHNDFGYLGFQCDATAAARFGGTNVLAVRAENSSPASRWYTGSGIFRHVWLETTQPLHFSHWGTCVTTPRVTKSTARIILKTRVRNESSVEQVCLLTTDIYRGNLKPGRTAKTRKKIPAGVEVEFVQSFTIKEPQLWSPETPTLYRAVSRLGQPEGICETPFGIRTIKFDAASGFLLNGQKVVLKGVCIHHDNGALGAASYDRAIARRLEVLKAMGCNAVRLSHNPHAPEMLDLCDRMGLLVFDEAFDKWSGFKPNGEGWRERLGNFIARDRNHPSVVIWSIGNEVKEQVKPEGTALAKSMVEFVHTYDPTRPVTCALHPGRGSSLELPELARALDVVSMNYQTQMYDTDHQKHPRMVILGSETLPYYAYNVGHKSDQDKFVAGNSWFALKNYVAGQFIWAGIDYLGESSGWPCKGWPLGLVDTCGFRKDFSYYQQSLQSQELMVRIVVFDPAGGDVAGKKGWDWPKMASHWNWSGAGEMLKVGVFANCPSVELVLNGRSLGQKELADFSARIMTWEVPNQSGTLRAIGRKDGKVVCSHELRTSGKPAKIVLFPDRDMLVAGGQDLASIEVDLVDAAGVLVPNSDRLIKFEVTGPAEIIGVDNGDLESPEPYQASQRTTRSGKCLAILRTSREPGRIAFTASAEGIPPATIYLEAEPRQRKE